MRVPPNPLTRAVEVAAQGPDLARRLAALIPRAAALLDSADRLLNQIHVIVVGLEQTLAHVQAVLVQLVATELAAHDVVDNLGRLEQRLTLAIDRYEPSLDQLLDTAAYAGRTVGPDQVDAAVAYLEFLPMLQTIDRELIPMLATFRTVAPDLTELVAVSRGLNELMGSLPGLGRAKKRVDEELAQDVDESSGSR